MPPQDDSGQYARKRDILGPVAESTLVWQKNKARLVPLVVGITGHRDLCQEDDRILRSRVREFFCELHKKYPKTPLVALSALAEGADQLCADEALKCKGVQLFVPLPVARDVYEREFSSPESVKEFNRLCERATVVIDLQGREHRRSPKTPVDTPEERYRKLGIFIVQHCQILLALWDGNDSDKPGGTADVVGFQREGLPIGSVARPSLLDDPETGPIHHIVTRRGNRTPVGPGLTAGTCISWTTSRAGSRTLHERGFARLDGFNRDARGLSEDTLAASRRRVLDDEVSDALDTAAQVAREGYATADALAIANQGWTWITLLALLVMGLAAVICFSAYAHLDLGPGWLAGYLAVILVAYLIFVWSAPIEAPLAALSSLWNYRWDFQSKYLDYRALAEGMRVQLFWQIYGLPACAADHYLRKQRTEMDWIRHAIRSWTSLGDRPSHNIAAPTLNPYKARSLLLDHWVTSQQAFFAQNQHRDERKLQNAEGGVLVLFCIALGLAIGLFIFDSRLHESLQWVHRPLIVAVILLVSLSALVEIWAEKTAVGEQAKQYVRMGELFKRAEIALELDTVPDPHQLVLDLGNEALAENGDWLLLHRSRPVSVPRG